MIRLNKADTLLFIGDSISDAGRNDYFQADLGQGYVNMIAGLLYRQFFHYGLLIINRGIGGNVITDLENRWQEDCLRHNPNIVTIQIGINDLWGIKDSKDLEQFTSQYQGLISSLKSTSSVRHILIMEPFMVAERDELRAMEDQLNHMQVTLKELAQQEEVHFVETHQIINRLAKGLTSQFVTGDDGIHPTSFGHAHLAERWFVTAKL